MRKAKPFRVCFANLGALRPLDDVLGECPATTKSAMRCQAAAQSVARTNASHSSLAKQDDGANAPYSALCAVQPSLLEALRFSTFVGRVPRLVLKDTPSDKKSAEPEGGFPPLPQRGTASHKFTEQEGIAAISTRFCSGMVLFIRHRKHMRQQIKL